MASSCERVLITGGGGFIGAALTRKLVADGHDVHLLLRPNTSFWRLADLKQGFAKHWADLRDGFAVRQAVTACRPQIVYHLATLGVFAFQNNRSEILATNLLGTANLLESLLDVDYQAFVNVGSSSEYGHHSSPLRESDPLTPRTDYAVSKAAATLLCQAEAFRGRPISTVRVFSAYGPAADPRRLVPDVMASCLRGKSPRVTDGCQPRDFIYLDDVVSLLETAAHCPSAHGKVLHAGTGRQHTVRAMIETIIAVSGAGVTPRFGVLPSRTDEPTSWVADITQTCQITSWRPKFDLRSGVEKTWHWFTKHSMAYAA
jgi:nucleoside-diphosphate-sugar epimerase